MNIWIALYSVLCIHFSVDLDFGIIEKPVVRINQIGFRPEDPKSAVILAQEPVNEWFDLISTQTGEIVYSAFPKRFEKEGWGNFKYAYNLGFSDFKQLGAYYWNGRISGSNSSAFKISSASYHHHQETLLEFMRQQRCGYNPFLDIVCHQRDGRSMYGPVSDSTYVDVSGGWHDAGDQLKYLITSSYAVGHLLTAYELYPAIFSDHFNELGQPGSNNIPDILDEVKWGLEWIHKLHYQPDRLIHQVADDRDHIGWKMPDKDMSDYGWGPDSYRVAYFATGKPQGLREYKSEATGFANIAGRSSAAMALAYRIWKEVIKDTIYANYCLEASMSLYNLGRQNEGYQQGNSYGAPYRYLEETWADDMEWGAAELYKATGDKQYLADAVKYARIAGTISWMNRDTAGHYQYYPFVNLAHFSLFECVGKEFQDTLTMFYRNGIEYIRKKSRQNPYGIGIPFIWCSNNLVTSFITQVILYEKMTGDTQFHEMMINHRDWLFGRNPWGTSMFTGIPETGDYPVDIHTSIWALRQRETRGGLVDGPVFGSIFRSLRGIHLLSPDEYALFQNNYVVYHDDIGDYSTNEPTMDGTAGSMIMMAYLTGE